MGAPYAPARNRAGTGRVPRREHDLDAPTRTPPAERVGRRDHALGAAATALVIAAWTVLAAWRPDVTYHLAPVFAGAAWPVALRRGGPIRVAPVDAARGALAGAGSTVLAALVLWAVGLLDGPTLWNDGPAIVETLPAMVVGAVGGYRHARCGPVG
ncbi:MAG: hypothetical protein ACLGHQ_01215 [Acidimicrobiia bacterium]